MKSSRLLTEIVLFAVVIAIGFGAVQYQRRNFSKIRVYRPFQEKLYLPEGDRLRIAALGYDNVYADILWLRAIQAFGGRWEYGKDVAPIYRYFDALTDLDPKFIEAYKLANLILGDEAKNYEKSFDILRKGMEKNPESWEIPFLGVYNAVWQYDDPKTARWFAYMAGRKPDRPEFVARMIEYVERRSGRYEVSFRMNLSFMLGYLETGNSVESRMCSNRFFAILDKWYIEKITENCRRFIKHHGRDPRTIEELVQSPSWEPFTLPTMQGLEQAIKRHRTQPGLPSRSEEIYKESLETFDKRVPFEPQGYQYVIREDLLPKATDTATTGTLAVTAENADKLPESHFKYIGNERELLEVLYSYVQSISGLIQSFQAKNGRYPISIEEMLSRETNKPLSETRFNYQDPLGGRFVYNAATGEFVSTSLQTRKPAFMPIFIE